MAYLSEGAMGFLPVLRKDLEVQSAWRELQEVIFGLTYLRALLSAIYARKLPNLKSLLDFRCARLRYYS